VLRKLDRGQEVDRGVIQIIADEILRLERIAIEVLDLSRKSPLNLVTQDLNDIISETLQVQAGKLKYQNIKIEKDFSPDRLEILSDKDRLKQVFFNLVQNAAEAMADGGKIRITTGRNGDYVYLKITDSGCGMDAITRSKLFTPFFTSKRTGTGLGLPVSKKIIDDHGGSILVESAPERGSIFTINLPARVNPSERRV
jgi:signal transduction histidine kinase